MSDGDRINVGGIVADILLDVGGLDGTLEMVRSRLAKVEAEIGQVQQAFRVASGDTDQLESKLDELLQTKQKLIEAEGLLANAVRQEAAAMGEAARAAGSAADATRKQEQSSRSATESANALSRSFKGAAMAGLSVSRGFQDVAQAGPAAALNNVEFAAAGVAQAFGATTGQAMMVGAAMQGLATVTYLAWENYDRLLDAFDVGISNPLLQGLEGVSERIKEISKELDDLRGKKRLNAGEYIDLKNLQEELKALKAIKAQETELATVTEARSKDQRETASGFNDAVAESGGKNALEELEQALEAKAETDGVNLGRDALGGLFREKYGRNATDKELAAMEGQKFLYDQAEDTYATPKDLAASLFRRAGKGGDKDARDEIKSLVGAGSDFGKKITQFSPETKEKEREEKKAERERLKTEREKKTEADKAKTQRDRKVAEEAKAVLAGPLGVQAIKGTLTEAMVKQAMLATGSSAAKVKDLGPDVFKKVQEETAEKVAKYGHAKGLSAAQAKPALLIEEKEKREREENERSKREAATANKTIPGLSRRVEASLLESRIAGDDPKEAGKSLGEQVAAALEQKGVSKEEAKLQAKAVIEQGQQGVDERVDKKAFDLQNKIDNRKVEVFDAAGLAAKVQSAVGPEDSTRKSLNFQEKMVEYLAKIATASESGTGDPLSGWEVN